MRTRADLTSSPARTGRVTWIVLLLLLVLGAAGLFVLRSSDDLPVTGRAHVVLISVDTLRADRVLDPEGKVATPRIDELAADGVLFGSCYSHAPMTLPSHTALFASRPPSESGVLVNGAQVPDALPLLAEHLREHGYETSGVISMPVLRPYGQVALARGFDHFHPSERPLVTADEISREFRQILEPLDPEHRQFLFVHFADPHAPYNAHGAVEREAEIRLDGQVIDRVPTSMMTWWEKELDLDPGEHVLEVRSSHDFVMRRFRGTFNAAPRDRPEVNWERRLTPEFLKGQLLQPSREVELRFTSQAEDRRPHQLVTWVHDVPDPELDAPSRYDSEVEYADGYVGQVLDALREKGMYDSSLIVLTSDHGEALSEYGGGHGHNVSDDLIHVPLLIKPPASLPGARRGLAAEAQELVRHIDVTPTILEICGLPPLPGQRGASLLRHDPHRVVVSETYRPEAETNQISFRDARHKLVYLMEEGRFELFDLQADPRERHDLFAKEGDAFLDWQKQLRIIGAVTGTGEALDLDALDPEARDQLEALGYFGGE